MSKPFPLVQNGNLISLDRYMIRTRDRDTVRVARVKEHAEDVDVQQGRVRLLDKHGNDEADNAVDLGRRHQSGILIDARRRLLGTRSHWYRIMIDWHRFMVVIAQVWVNHDDTGGNVPYPLLGDQGAGLRFVSLQFG